MLLDLSFIAGLMMVLTILLFFRDFFWRSGLLENWIRSYVRGHWFGCSLQPGMLLNSSCQEVGFISPFVVIDPTDLGATTAVAQNLLQDLCLTISYLSPTQNPCLFTLWY